MAKKQFIRHLEFYGFPDQNGYASDINGANVDLSEIIKKNKEQDEEIKELTDEKASKNDLDSLSGTVDTLISAQTEFNNTVVETISGITNDINTLKEVDNEFAEQLSAITSGVDDAMEAIELLGERVDDVEDAISGINDSIETIIEDYAKK
jgi:methyl-accepting chemotaxis protein